MATPNLIPQPQVVQQPQATGGVDIGKVLSSPDFNNLDPQTQKKLLTERYNPAIANLDDDEFIAWKKQSASRLGIKDTSPNTPRVDRIIEFARPFVSDAVGGLAGVIAGPETLGAASAPAAIAAKGGVDALLQHLESRPPTSLASSALNLKPGGAASTVVNSGEMLGTNALLGKIIGMFGKGVAAAKGATEDFITPEAKTIIARNEAKLAKAKDVEDAADVVNKTFQQQFKDFAKQGYYKDPESGNLIYKAPIKPPVVSTTVPELEEVPKTPSLAKSFADNINKEGILSKSTMTYGMTLPFSLISGHVSPYQGAAALYTGVKLSKAAAKTLSENPRTARIIGAMNNGEPLGVSQQMASKAITDVLQGSGMSMTATGPGGDQEVILKDGKLVPISQ
jgi:hypothetical protein